MGYPRFRKARAHKQVVHAVDDLVATSSASWVTVGITDIVLAAAVGDVIEVGLNTYVPAAAGHVFLDAQTIVGGSPVNSAGSGNAVSSGDDGVSSWLSTSGETGTPSGSVLVTVVSGDLASGAVTLRLMYRSSATRNFYTPSSRPLRFWAKNLGPADPH